MAIAVDVQNRLDLPICDKCQMAEIDVDNKTFLNSPRGGVVAVEVTVACEHREACMRAVLMDKQSREAD